MDAHDTYEAGHGQLGWIVSWRVPAEIPLQDLRASLCAAGLDPDLAGEMRNEHAFRRSLRDMNESRVIRKLRREDKFVYFQITRELLDEHKIEYDREAEVCLNTETGDVSCAESTKIEDTARLLLGEHMRKRLTSDLTRLVQRVYDAAKADLIPIRKQGFAYFVPSHHEKLVEQSRQLLNAIGGKLQTFAVKLGSEETKESVAESMADYFTDLLKEFRDKCDGLNEKSRSDVRERRMEQVGELRQKLELYRGLLCGLATQVQSDIDAGEKVLIEALARPMGSENDSLPPDEPAPEQEPAGEPVAVAAVTEEVPF